MDCFKRAAGLGDVSAQFRCGQMYYKGEGTDRNKNEARAWFEKAADQGYEKVVEFLQNKF